jgi:solute carrier family 35 protein F5
LWTASNFLASTIFADDTYSKPFFVTYVNSSFFILPLIPIVIRKLYENPSEIATLKELIPRDTAGYSKVQATDDGEGESASMLRSGSPSESMLLDDDPVGAHVLSEEMGSERLGLVDTAKLSLEFAFLWFAANYFMAACLEYTTVASSTILTSTSSIWTLLVGSIWGVERFTIKKLCGVLASLAGIILISTVDLSGQSDKNRGSFPHKTTGELAIGNAMAFFSAVLYGIYAVVMKKRIGDESRVNMPLFFGMVGLFDVMLLWPFFIILHLVGIETWELPPGGKVLTIILVCFFSTTFIPHMLIIFAGQFAEFPDQRLLLGILYAANQSAHRHSGTEHDHSSELGRPNVVGFAVCQHLVLAGRCRSLRIIHLYQSRRNQGRGTGRSTDK